MKEIIEKPDYILEASQIPPKSKDSSGIYTQLFYKIYLFPEIQDLGNLHSVQDGTPADHAAKRLVNLPPHVLGGL